MCVSMSMFMSMSMSVSMSVSMSMSDRLELVWMQAAITEARVLRAKILLGDQVGGSLRLL